MNHARPAVFLDRDGTLIDELGFLSDPDDLRLFPGAGKAVRRLNDAGFWVGLVTNQSGVARGLLTEDRLAEVHARLAELLAQSGARLDAISYCPHHPTEGEPPYRRTCICRKPEPGLVLELISEHGLDPQASWMVGDAARDLLAGTRAGLGGGILVGTGKGKHERTCLPLEVASDTFFDTDLTSAVERILSAMA